ncbi:MAG: HlyD family type I secretion periplasmic adaptor subunit [Bacteroidota bacterium]
MAGSRSASVAAEAGATGSGAAKALARRWRRRMEEPRSFLIAVLALMALLVLWASIAEVDQVVRAEGRIVPAGRAQQIQHLEGGIVASINTSEGAVVKRGDLLLTIDATSAGANLSETEIKLTSQRIRAARLETEARGQATIALPPELASTRAADEERRLFTSRTHKLEQELRVFDEQNRQRMAELAELESRRGRLAGELATARQRSAMLTGMASRNAASRLEVLDAQSREQRMATELGEAEGAIPKIRASINEAHARADEARARFRSQAQEDLVSTRAEIERLQQIITAQADRLTRTDVRAPTDGVVNRITANTVGGVIKAGDVIVELTPTAGEVLIEARARPSDRGELRPNLGSKVRISAYDSGALGTLAGRVVEVSADTVADAKGEPFYRVGIRIDAIPAPYAGKLLAPGMTVTADIVTGRRTVARHLLSPLTKFADNTFRDAR